MMYKESSLDMEQQQGGAVACSTRPAHVVFKTHFDLGFTGLASTVVNQYLHIHIPRALDLAEKFREQHSDHGFVWTTGSWLIRMFLERANAVSRRRMEQAILKGDISWHGLPFTTHTEMMDRSLFEYGLGITRSLDRQFGRRTVSAKMTDVPGHTRAMVPLLAKAGIRFLHIGVNPASTAPDVPPVFLWRDPASQTELVVAYSATGYGGAVEIDGLDDLLFFAHSYDNHGPQSVPQVNAFYQKLMEDHPHLQPFAADLNEFGEKVWAVRQNLPVIESEIGDTWIHGVGTDPANVKRFLRLQRWRRQVLDENPSLAHDPQLLKFSNALIMVPEHTWGRDIKFFREMEEGLPVNQVIGHYAQKAFLEDLRMGVFHEWESSWLEQRRYLDSGLQALEGSPLHAQALEVLREDEPDADAWTSLELSKGVQKIHAGPWTLSIDLSTGGVCGLSHRDKKLSAAADAEHQLGRFFYQTFTADEVWNYHQTYNHDHELHGYWSWPDFGKDGMFEEGSFPKQTIRPGVQTLRTQTTPVGSYVEIALKASPEAETDFGCPKGVTLTWFFPEDPKQALQVTLAWTAKQPCRIPEATWLEFHPGVENPQAWRLQKLDALVNPHDVVSKGNRALHAVQALIHPQCRIDLLDTALVSPEKSRMWTFPDELPAVGSPWLCNINNNQWGTNFPMWFGEPARFRFDLSL